MGAFLTQDKSGYYWFLLGYLQDKNVYIRDGRLLPYTPGKLQTYVDYYPSLYNPVLPVTLTFKINGSQAAAAKISQPTGAAYANVSVPLGAFTFETWNGATLLRTEHFISKNYAMLLGVQAQSYDERLSDINLIKADIDFSQMRSERIYPIIGAMLGLAPPPGWSVQQYRDAILGNPMFPGLRQAFFDGTTQAGILGAAEAITQVPAALAPGQNGIRWTVRSRANSQPANPASMGFYVTSRADMSHAFAPPHYPAVCAFENWWGHAAILTVNGSVRTPPPETLRKATNSFLEGQVPQPYNLQGQTLVFTVNQPGVLFTTRTYSTTFGIPTVTAAQVAAQILSQNPGLTSAVYATAAGTLRLGVPPQAGKVFRITITGGSSLQSLGLVIGQSVDVSPDQASPTHGLTTPVSITDGATTWADGTDFNSVPATGQIVWNPSTAANTGVPPAGTLLTATYSYQMRREVMAVVEAAREVNDILEYVWR